MGRKRGKGDEKICGNDGVLVHPQAEGFHAKSRLADALAPSENAFGKPMR